MWADSLAEKKSNSGKIDWLHYTVKVVFFFNWQNFVCPMKFTPVRAVLKFAPKKKSILCILKSATYIAGKKRFRNT